MTDMATDWLGYICKSGYFMAQFDAATVEPVTGAILEVTASEGEYEGVTFSFDIAPPVRRYVVTWFRVEQALRFVEALTAAVAGVVAVEAESLSCDDDPEPMAVRVSSDVDGVDLRIIGDGEDATVEVARSDAAGMAQAVLAAVAYLVDHGHGDA